ncbi:transthyretin-like family protein [Massilia agilis]|uniref:Transthyretin-like family protein n=1 Tax=Massilia agilis TaxID=1811226 RepID=A0ABT2DE16_9BURK|nr:transthyretin-like family protein [Massilia agilis]MCS0809563.1 transthyretin-like family protein [Massilia agilis]
MGYTFRGRLCGLICDDCQEGLAGVTVRLYRNQDLETVTARVAAQPKDTFALLPAAEAGQKAVALLAEAQADADGNFSFQLGEKQNYHGEAFEIDVLVTDVPGHAGKPEREPLQFSITTLQPRWRQNQDGYVAVWDYCLPQRIWCYIRSLFGAWTICGRLTTCAEPHQPIGGATIRAYDADWWQDDTLGTAVTDAAGRFRIDYTSAKFRVTPFSPLINLEWVGGPDVYFTAELGGMAILTETQLDGRKPGRQNVGPCLCVDLCSDQVRPGSVETTPHWQQVEVFDIHPFPSASGFSAEGYAGTAAESYVFGGAVTLRGNCPLRNAADLAHSVEYRFLIGEWSWPGGTEDPAALPSIPPATMSPVTQLLPTHVGYLFYTNALGMADSAPVIVGPADVGADGWIKVDGKAVVVDMRNGTNAIRYVETDKFLRTFDLFMLNTPAITSAHPLRMPGGLPLSQAGRALTSAEREPVRRYRLMFEARDATSLATLASDTLGAIVLDNTPPVLALDLEELRTNACNPVSGENVHILYTIDHPHLRTFSLTIGNNGGLLHQPPELPTASFVPPPPPANYLFRGGAGGPHTPGNDGGFKVVVKNDPHCAYRCALSYKTRHYLADTHSIDRLYCK